MIAHFRAYFPAIPVKDNEVGLLFWHMAVNAVTHNWLFNLWMAFGFMALQTMHRECCRIFLRCMNIVTRQTGHGRQLEASASLEQFHLASVDIHRGFRVGLRQLYIFLQRFAGNVGKCRQERFAVARVAPGAKIHLPVAGESRWIEDGGVR